MIEHLINPQLFERIRELVMHARRQLQRSVNATMVQTYWDIGRMIVEEEQAGESRAAYGKAQLQTLADQLGNQFKKYATFLSGFSKTEDVGLAAGTLKSNYDIRLLLTYSAVFGIGLDTVPIPGDTSVDKISIS